MNEVKFVFPCKLACAFRVLQVKMSQGFGSGTVHQKKKLCGGYGFLIFFF